MSVKSISRLEMAMVFDVVLAMAVIEVIVDTRRVTAAMVVATVPEMMILPCLLRCPVLVPLVVGSSRRLSWMGFPVIRESRALSMDRLDWSMSSVLAWHKATSPSRSCRGLVVWQIAGM